MGVEAVGEEGGGVLQSDQGGGGGGGGGSKRIFSCFWVFFLCLLSWRGATFLFLYFCHCHPPNQKGEKQTHRRTDCVCVFFFFAAEYDS